MAGEFKHQTVGTKLTQSEWESAGLHQIDGNPALDVIVVSNPPSGKCKILNMYYDPDIGKAVFQYEDTPV